MPIDPKDFRRAIAGVHNKDTFNTAYAMIQSQEVDVSSTGESGKSALNFALEKLFTPLMASAPLSKDTVHWKLKILDELCAASASLEALKQKDTAALMSKVNERAKFFLAKVGAMYHTAPAPKPALSALIATLPETEKIFLSAYYVSNQIVSIAHRITPLEQRHREAIANGAFADIKHKVMLLFENHNDPGTLSLLSNIREQLTANEYKTLCLEAPMDWDMDVMKKNPSLQANELFKFVSSRSSPFTNIIPVDARLDDSKYFINFGLNMFVSKYMTLGLYGSIRDKGLVFNLCQVVAAKDGKVVAIFGIGHSNAIIDNLNRLGIPNTVTVPFVNPNNVFLTRKTNDEYQPVDSPEHNFTQLFTKYRATPLKLEIDTNKEKFVSFAEKRLGAASNFKMS